MLVLLPAIYPLSLAAFDDIGPPLTGTKPLTMTGDIASELVAGVDRFLLKQIDESTAKRAKSWKRDFSSHAAYQVSVEPNRHRLAHILGVRDPVRVDNVDHLNLFSSRTTIFRGTEFSVHTIRWPAFGDVTGEGLEAIPNNASKEPMPNVIVIPDADQTPEQLLGLVPGVPPGSQVARRLVESGCHVIVPALIDRTAIARNGRAMLTNREYVYRPAFELGRHPIGYEVQKVIALINWLTTQLKVKGRVGVFGYGEGGAIALYAAALDPRIDGVVVSGYFDDRNDVWRQPIDRNVFGLLEQFGDAEVASLIAPRTLIIEAAKGPELVIPPGTGGAPGRLTTPRIETVQAEVARARQLVEKLTPAPRIELVCSGPNGTALSEPKRRCGS